MILVLDEQKDIPNSVLLTIPVPTELFQIVFLIRGLKVGDHTDSRGTTGSSMFAKSSPTCVVEDLSIYMEILTQEFRAIWERLPILLRYRQILRQLLVRHNRVTSH